MFATAAPAWYDSSAANVPPNIQLMLPSPASASSETKDKGGKKDTGKAKKAGINDVCWEKLPAPVQQTVMNDWNAGA